MLPSSAYLGEGLNWLPCRGGSTPSLTPKPRKLRSPSKGIYHRAFRCNGLRVGLPGHRANRPPRSIGMVPSRRASRFSLSRLVRVRFAFSAGGCGGVSWFRTFDLSLRTVRVSAPLSRLKAAVSHAGIVRPHCPRGPPAASAALPPQPWRARRGHLRPVTGPQGGCHPRQAAHERPHRRTAAPCATALCRRTLRGALAASTRPPMVAVLRRADGCAA